MGSRFARRAFALGFITLTFGVGILFDGSVGSGLAFIALGVALIAIPLAAFIQALREIRDRPAAEVSPVAGDPRFRPRFRRVGALSVVLSTVPLIAAGLIMVAIYRYGAEEDKTAGFRAASLLLGGFFAGIPALLGGRLLTNGLQVTRGNLDGAEIALFMQRILLVFGGLAAWSAFGAKPIDAWPVMGGVALSVVAGCLLGNGALKRLYRDVRAAESERGGSSPTISGSPSAQEGMAPEAL